MPSRPPFRRDFESEALCWAKRNALASENRLIISAQETHTQQRNAYDGSVRDYRSEQSVQRSQIRNARQVISHELAHQRAQTTATYLRRKIMHSMLILNRPNLKAGVTRAVKSLTQH